MRRGAPFVVRDALARLRRKPSSDRLRDPACEHRRRIVARRARRAACASLPGRPAGAGLIVGHSSTTPFIARRTPRVRGDGSPPAPTPRHGLLRPERLVHRLENRRRRAEGKVERHGLEAALGRRDGAARRSAASRRISPARRPGRKRSTASRRRPRTWSARPSPARPRRRKTPRVRAARMRHCSGEVSCASSISRWSSLESSLCSTQAALDRVTRLRAPAIWSAKSSAPRLSLGVGERRQDRLPDGEQGLAALERSARRAVCRAARSVGPAHDGDRFERPERFAAASWSSSRPLCPARAARPPW